MRIIVANLSFYSLPVERRSSGRNRHTIAGGQLLAGSSVAPRVFRLVCGSVYSTIDDLSVEIYNVTYESCNRYVLYDVDYAVGAAEVSMWIVEC